MEPYRGKKELEADPSAAKEFFELRDNFAKKMGVTADPELGYQKQGWYLPTAEAVIRLQPKPNPS